MLGVLGRLLLLSRFRQLVYLVKLVLATLAALALAFAFPLGGL
jgi:hypothetical protein